MYSKTSESLVIVAVILPFFAAVAVAFRFQARRIKGADYGSDDWVILAALITQLGSMGVTIYWAVDGGAGDSRANLAKNHDEALMFEKLLFAGPIIFASTITLIKVSILLFYKRIFTSPRFHIILYVVMAVVAGWFVTSVLGTVFSTWPVSNAWLHPFKKRNINYYAFLLSMASLNLTLDVAVLVLPVIEVRKLHMTTKRKIGVIGIFWLGAFCVVASIIRLYYFVVLTRGEDVTITVTIWSFIEPCASIMAACGPTLAAFWNDDKRGLRSIIASVRSTFSIRSSSSQPSTTSDDSSGHRELRMPSAGGDRGWDGSAEKSYRVTSMRHDSSANHTLNQGDEDERSTIHVQRDFSVQHEEKAVV